MYLESITWCLKQGYLRNLMWNIEQMVFFIGGILWQNCTLTAGTLAHGAPW